MKQKIFLSVALLSAFSFAVAGNLPVVASASISAKTPITIDASVSGCKSAAEKAKAAAVSWGDAALVRGGQFAAGLAAGGVVAGTDYVANVYLPETVTGVKAAAFTLTDVRTGNLPIHGLGVAGAIYYASNIEDVARSVAGFKSTSHDELSNVFRIAGVCTARYVIPFTVKYYMDKSASSSSNLGGGAVK